MIFESQFNYLFIAIFFAKYVEKMINQFDSETKFLMTKTGGREVFPRKIFFS